MSVIAQDIFVLTLVATAVLWVSWQVVSTFRKAKGGFGGCCSKGCGGHEKLQSDSSKRVVFIPVETLRESARRSLTK